jgi:hypothetical protein
MSDQAHHVVRAADHRRLLPMLVAVTAVVVGAIAFVAGFVHGEPAGLAAAIAATSPSTAPTPVTSVALGDGIALRALLLPPPAGARSVAVPDSKAGVQTVSQFVDGAFAGDATAVAELRARGFASTVTTAWIDGDVQGSTRLIQFDDATGAEGFVLQQEASLRGQKGATSYGIGQVAHGRDFVVTPVATLIGQVGPFVLELSYHSTAAHSSAAHSVLALDPAVEMAAFGRQAQALKP